MRIRPRLACFYNNMAQTPTTQLASQARTYRKLHKWVGIAALVFFTLVASTGLLLAWKKNSGGYIQAPTIKGTASTPAQWLSLQAIQEKALYYLDSCAPGSATAIDRIDVRPGSRVAKVVFEEHYHGLQIDLATGALLAHEIRRADFIEQLHDGSLLDRLSGLNFFKLLYSTLAGVSLLFLAFSGWKLWYNPKKMKALKKGS